MYFLVRSRVTGPLELSSAKKVLAALESPNLKVICHFGFLSEPGGVQIVEAEGLEELREYLSKFQDVNASTEIVPLMTHEETVGVLKRYIKKLEVEKPRFV